VASATGEQAGNLERDGARRETSVDLLAGNTLKVSRGNELERARDQGHERSRCEGSGTARRGRTRGRQSPGGDRAARRLTPCVTRRTPAQSKALKTGLHLRRLWRKPWIEGVVERQEGNGHRRGGTAATEGKPLKGSSRTWLRGEINPQGRRRSKPSRARETPRAERSGLGIARGEWTSPADVAMGTRPQGRCSKPKGIRAGTDRRTLKER
jgi:hypothetical protein